MITFETTVSTMTVLCNECKQRSCFMTILQNELHTDEDLLGFMIEHRCPFVPGQTAKFSEMAKKNSRHISEEAGRIVLNDMEKTDDD